MNDKFWFFLVILYLLVDYGRPQDIWPIIGYARPGMVVILTLSFLVVLSGRVKSSDSKQTRMVWLFILLLATYVLFARNNYLAYMTTKTILSYMPFILSTIMCVTSMPRLKKMIFVFIILMIYNSIFSLFHEGIGSGHYFQDENDLALYILAWLPFCYYMLFNEKKMVSRLIYGAGSALGLCAIVVSHSRGGFLGLVSIAATIWLQRPKKVLSLALIFLVGLSVYIYGGSSYRTEMSSITDLTENTAHGRILTWAAGWKMFLDNPVGVGGNNFQVRFPEYQSKEFKKSMWGRVAHSLWVTLISETGIFGVIIYFLLLYYNAKEIVMLKRIEVNDKSDSEYFRCLSHAYMASFVGYFSAATFLSVLYYAHYWYLTGLLVAISRVSKAVVEGEKGNGTSGVLRESAEI